MDVENNIGLILQTPRRQFFCCPYTTHCDWVVTTSLVGYISLLAPALSMNRPLDCDIIKLRNPLLVDPFIDFDGFPKAAAVVQPAAATGNIFYGTITLNKFCRVIMIKKCLQDPQEGKKWMLTCCNYYKITLQKKYYHAWWKFSSERNEAVWNEKHFRDTYKILNHFLEHFINHKPLVSGEWSHCYTYEPSFEHEVKAKVFFC